MAVKTIIKKGAYFDSVTLMTVAKKLRTFDGVEDCAVVMATRENKAILEASGLLNAEILKAADADLAITVKAKDAKTAETIIAEAGKLLKKGAAPTSGKGEQAARSVEAAVKAVPGANMAIISVAGRYAGAVAREALESGMNVMLFSDNISLEKEIELKNFAHKKGLIVMGPDCGTAIINGVPLAFANAVSAGDIGLVAAAGTGLQEVTSIISNTGGGVSQAIGTGGRDVKKDVGGISFIDGINALAEDDRTKVIVLVSKPPHQEVLKKITAALKKIKKPVVSVFLGGDKKELEKIGVYACTTLEEAAMKAVQLSSGEQHKAPDAGNTAARVKKEAAGLKKSQKYLRGLFSGGTFVSEAQVILSPMLGRIYSNAPLDAANRMKSALKSEKHAIVDLGDDEFTVGRPHPMIDFSLRNRRIEEEAKDPETAVILLDVVIGFGSNIRPVEDIAPAIETAIKTAKKGGRHIPVICSVTGTENDPQCRSKVIEGLRKAGAIVMPTNASACRLAGEIIKAA